MTDSSPSVSVVVPTRNRRDLLERVLPPLLEQPGADEVVVVVDGSTDGSLELLERLRADSPHLRPLPIEHTGATGARHAGVSAARGEVVLVLDDDVIPSPGLVAGHARHHAGEERRLVVGYMPVESRPPRPGEYPRAIYAREYERTVAAWEADPGEILSSMWFGNISIRREDYLTISREELVVGYHEDMEFGLRCREMGLTGVFDRSLSATHLYERDPEGFLRDARSSGRNYPEVRARHERTLGPLPDDFPASDLPGPLRPLIRLTASAGPLRAFMRLAVVAAGRLRLYTLERHGGSVLWRAEQLRVARGLL